MIPETILQLAEKAVNRALETDVLASSELSSLQGTTFAIECQTPPIPISLETSADGVLLSNGIAEHASVVLSGTLPALMSLASSIAKEQSDFSSSGVEIRGDVGALLQLSRALSRLDIDWEDIVGDLIGEIPARLFFFGLERAQTKTPEIKKKVTEVSANFLTGPIGLAKGDQASEMREMLRQLQYRLDRIQARIGKIKQGVDKVGGAESSIGFDS